MLGKYAKQGFGREFRDMKVMLVGESLGGILALIVAYDMPEIKGIVAIGTGDELTVCESHLLKSFPKSRLIERRAKKFRGEFVLHVAGDDEVFSKESSERLIKHIGSKNKQLIMDEGVNHCFTKRTGVESRDPMGTVNKQAMETAMRWASAGQPITDQTWPELLSIELVDSQLRRVLK